MTTPGQAISPLDEKLSLSISGLPNEIISQIFLVGTTEWRTTAPLALPFPVLAASVCYHWRQLARSNPSLWSFLVAPLHKEDEDCLYWISDWIGLSANLPLSVVVDDKLRRPRRSSEATNRLASEAVTLITQSWNRLRSLDISLDSFSLVKNQIIQLRHAPNLRQLSLCFRGPPFATIFIPEVDRPLPPSVTKLRAQNLALQSPCNLTSLTMHKPRLGYEGTQILFSGCPNLANLIIHNLVPVNSPIPAKRTEIRAESLQSLAIHSHGIDERGAVYFLSFLKIPNLSYLEVDGNTRIASILRSSISSSNVVKLRISNCSKFFFISHPIESQRDINFYHSLSTVEEVELVHAPLHGLISTNDFSSQDPSDANLDENIPWPALRRLYLDTHTMSATDVGVLVEFLSSHKHIQSIGLSATAIRHLHAHLIGGTGREKELTLVFPQRLDLKRKILEGQGPAPGMVVINRVLSFRYGLLDGDRASLWQELP